MYCHQNLGCDNNQGRRIPVVTVALLWPAFSMRDLQAPPELILVWHLKIPSPDMYRNCRNLNLPRFEVLTKARFGNFERSAIPGVPPRDLTDASSVSNSPHFASLCEVYQKPKPTNTN
ncbi:hypothetical protein TNCV_2003291 [Trichonephila clavipes]|nr:hypothetical protein TNCV_2003291 [Trichonephila clavipes]